MSSALLISFLAAITASGVGPLAGTWTQKSSGPELTLTPKIKIMPSMAATGFAIGTSGYGGSQTTTTIQNDYSSIQTDRAMTLSVRTDGSFTWVIDKSRDSGKPGCKVVTREEKTGVVRAADGRATFQISGGSNSTRDTCDPAKTSASAKPASSETYSYAVSPAGLKISGSGGVNWAFSPR